MGVTRFGRGFVGLTALALLLAGATSDLRSGLAQPEDLKVGLTVSIEGNYSSDSELLATQIEILGRSKVRGLVESVDAAAGTLIIQGVPVTTSGRTRITDISKRPIELSQLSEGSTVKARGLLQTDGSLDAGEIEVRRPSSWGRVELEGIVEAVDGKRKVVRILGNDILVTRAARIRVGGWERAWFEDLAVGKPIELEGASLADGSVIATYILVRRPDDVEITGSIDSIDSGTESLSVLGTQIVTIPGTRCIGIAGGSIPFDALHEGFTVEIKGRLDNGKVTAEQIEITSSSRSQEVQIESRLEAIAEDSVTVMGVTFRRNRNTGLAYE